ncbi:MAG: hypothetical protein IPM54_44285 [Polyangiaceae bacterium]|nr:hypothetical protein [Polyangiaceae bacterium]
MERSISELKEEISGLERAIEVFESRIAEVRWLVAMLEKAKATKPGFAFWEWEHRNLASKAASERLGDVLAALDARVAGQWEQGDRWQDVPGVPSEILYVERPRPSPRCTSSSKRLRGFPATCRSLRCFTV